MSIERGPMRHGPANRASASAGEDRPTLVLIVPEATAVSAPVPGAPVIAPPAAVDAAFLARHAPQVIVAPLFTAGFDLLDFAAGLVRLGYAGSLRALSPPLPNPGLVRRELRAAAPGLDIDFYDSPA